MATEAVIIPPPITATEERLDTYTVGVFLFSRQKYSDQCVLQFNLVVLPFDRILSQELLFECGVCFHHYYCNRLISSINAADEVVITSVFLFGNA